MKVNDEDLDTFRRAAIEAAEEDQQSPESVAMVSIINELIAMRKVADAAVAFRGTHRGSGCSALCPEHRRRALLAAHRGDAVTTHPSGYGRRSCDADRASARERARIRRLIAPALADLRGAHARITPKCICYYCQSFDDIDAATRPEAKRKKAKGTR